MIHSSKTCIHTHTQSRGAWGKFWSHSCPVTGTESRVWPTVSQILEMVWKLNRVPLGIPWELGISPYIVGIWNGELFHLEIPIIQCVMVLKSVGSYKKSSGLLSIKMNQLESPKSVNLPMWKTFTFLPIHLHWTKFDSEINGVNTMKSLRDILSGGQVKSGSLLFAQEGQLQVTSLQMCTSLYDIQTSHLLSQALHVLFYPIPNQHLILQCVELTGLLWCILKQLNIVPMAFLTQGWMCLAATLLTHALGCKSCILSWCESVLSSWGQSITPSLHIWHWTLSGFIEISGPREGSSSGRGRNTLKAPISEAFAQACFLVYKCEWVSDCLLPNWKCYVGIYWHVTGMLHVYWHVIIPRREEKKKTNLTAHCYY